jgi:pre-mRNA-processing factor SLU7
MTHKTKECLERPRKLGAKFTGQNIRPDEFIMQNDDVDFDGKRDRWNGYDPAEHQRVIDQYQEIEEARRRIREKEVEEKLMKKAKAVSGEAAEASDELDIANLSSSDEEDAADALDDDDDVRYADGADMPGQKVDLKSRTTIRNLRLREDTAKYLRNLDVNSAYYDPKTRSMRENPNQERDPRELAYAGDNFVRASGDAPKVSEMTVFAWEAQDRGIDVHLQANPTQAELMHKEYKHKKAEVKDTVRDALIAKYGGEEHLQAPAKEMLLAQSDHYVEYSRAGTLVKGPERATVRSKYDEDNHSKYGSGHTAIFGSYFDVESKKWGYDCCHSTTRQSYCTGRAGKNAVAQHQLLQQQTASSVPAKSLKDQHLDRMLENYQKRKTTSDLESADVKKKK